MACLRTGRLGGGLKNGAGRLRAAVVALRAGRLRKIRADGARLTIVNNGASLMILKADGARLRLGARVDGARLKAIVPADGAARLEMILRAADGEGLMEVDGEARRGIVARLSLSPEPPELAMRGGKSFLRLIHRRRMH